MLLLTASLLGATLLGAPFTSAAGADGGKETDIASAECDTADAISKARAAFDWHTSYGTNEAMFWRILNTLDAENLPAKPADVTDDTITAADAATFSNGKTWAGWVPINAALACTEKAAEAESGDEGDGADGGGTEPAECDTADAISKARAAFDWHTSYGTNEAMFWRILNTLDAENLPAKPADVTDDTITAADAATFSNGKTWAGWVPINAALACTEKAAEAESGDEGDGADGGGTEPAECDTADAISKARAAFDWHTSYGTNEAMFWRILNTLDAENLPAKPADVTDDTITAADAATFSNGKTWAGWVPINAALACTEKAAEDTDDDSGTDGQDTQQQQQQSSQDSQQQSSQDQQPQQQQSSEDQQSQQDSLQQQSQQDQAPACTDWDSSDITIGEDDLLMVKLGNTPEGCDNFDSTIALEIDVVASHNGTKPYRDGCTSTPDNWGDNVSLLGIMINTKNGWLQASPCDDNTIVERQVIIRDTNPAGGAATKTITITDDDSYHPMSPDWVYVRRQSGSTGQTPPYNAYISVQTGRSYYEPYRLLVLQTGAAHPQPNKNSFSDDGATITINVPADDDGFTPRHKWYDQRVDCYRTGPGWVQVHVYRQNGPKFDTSTYYRDGGDKIQVCW